MFFQAFAVIAASPLQIDLSCVLEQVITELTAFLRKVNQFSTQTIQSIPFISLLVLGLHLSIPHKTSEENSELLPFPLEK